MSVSVFVEMERGDVCKGVVSLDGEYSFVIGRRTVQTLLISLVSSILCHYSRIYRTRAYLTQPRATLSTTGTASLGTIRQMRN